MVISESSSKKRVRKSFSKSPQFLMESSGSFMKPFGGESLQSTDEQTCQYGIVIYYVPCLTLEVVNVLVR